MSAISTVHKKNIVLMLHRQQSYLILTLHDISIFARTMLPGTWIYLYHGKGWLMNILKGKLYNVFVLEN